MAGTGLAAAGNDRRDFPLVVEKTDFAMWERSFLRQATEFLPTAAELAE